MRGGQFLYAPKLPSGLLGCVDTGGLSGSLRIDSKCSEERRMVACKHNDDRWSFEFRDRSGSIDTSK